MAEEHDAPMAQRGGDALLSTLLAALQELPLGVSVFDRGLRLVFANLRFRQLLGLSEEWSLPGVALDNLLRFIAARGEYGAGDPEQLAAERLAVIRSGASEVYRRARPDGTILEVSSHPLADGGFITTYADVTREARAEAQTRAERDRLQTVIDGMPGGVSMFDRDLRLIAFNQRFVELLGFEELISRNPAPTMEEFARYNTERGEYGEVDVETTVAELLERARRPVAHLFERVRPNGRVLEVRGQPLPEGGFVTIYTDVTQRRHAELELLTRTTYLTEIIANIPQGISVFDADLRLKYWNDEFIRVLELPRDAVYRDVTFADLLRVPARRGDYGPGDPEAHVATRVALAREFKPHRFERTKPSGLTHLVNGSPMLVDGRVVGFITTYTDITDRKHVEAEVRRLNETLQARVVERTEALERSSAELNQAMERLVQSEKLAALGRLVAGVAHELNTPLGTTLTVASTVTHRVEAFRAEVESGAVRRSRLDEFMNGLSEAASLIERNSERAARLIQDFKQVAADQASSRRRSFLLDRVIDELLSTLAPRFACTGIEVVSDVAACLEFDSYPGPLEQVVQNLCVNSLIHGFPDGRGGKIFLSAAAIDDAEVELVVVDDGIGMPEEVQRRAFDPFFTTRLGQGGTGLGLYIVYTLVTGALGGRIEIRSLPGRGTQFNIRLPRKAPQLVRESGD